MSSKLRLLAIVTTSCSGPSPSPAARAGHVDTPAAPWEGPTLTRVFRDVLIQADYRVSMRWTYQLETAGSRARMTVTGERNDVARLDEWTTPWVVVKKATVSGSIEMSDGKYTLRLKSADGKTAYAFWCGPRELDVLSADARLAASAGDCRDAKGTWSPSTTTHVVAPLSCSSGLDDGVDPFPDAAALHFADPPGIEWVDEDNGCVAQGQGYRQLTPP